MPRTRKPGPEPYVYVIYINTTPARLWRALTEKAFIRRYWMGRSNTSDWKPGSPIESRSPEGELEWQGKIIENRPPTLLKYSFKGTTRGRPETWVSFAVTPVSDIPYYRGSGLRLTVTHQGFKPGSAPYRGISSGWPAILGGLKSLLETGRALGIRYVG